MLSLQEFVQNRYNKPLQNVAMKSFTWLFLTTASLQVAKNQLTLVRKKFTTSQLSS